MDVFRQIHEYDARIPVIFITGHGTTETAIEAMKLGAFDCLLKPLELSQLESLIQRAMEISRLMRVPALPETESPQEGADLIIGRCPPMQEVYKTIGRVIRASITPMTCRIVGT